MTVCRDMKALVMGSFLAACWFVIISVSQDVIKTLTLKEFAIIQYSLMVVSTQLGDIAI